MNLSGELQQIHAMLAGGDAGGAFRRLAPLVASHPGRADVLHLLALVERARGDLRSARDAMERAVATGSATAEMHNSLGNILSDLGELRAADRAFEAAIARQPGYGPAWINRGRLASRLGDGDRAIAMLERACTLQPASALAHSSLSQAYRDAGSFDKAQRAARRAVELAPGQINPRLALGAALRSADRAVDALREYDLAERGGLRRPEILEARGGAWLELQEVEKALADYDRLTSEFPDYLRGHEARARLVREFGLPSDPFSSYRQLAEAHPGIPEVWAAWLNNLLAFGEFEQAAEIASRAARAVGPSPLWSHGLAVALSETGSVDQADIHFESAVSQLGGNVALLNAYARHLIKARRPEEAEGIAGRSLALAPDDQLSWAYLGTAWRMLGDEREFWLHDYERHVSLTDAVPPGETVGAEAFARSVAPVLRKLHFTRTHPPDQSLRNGTQTPGALFDRPEPEIRRIKAAVTAAALAFAEKLPEDPSHPLLRRRTKEVRFAGSWSVRLTRTGFHINHVHSAGWLSSAYYFAIPEQAPEDTDHSGWLQLGAPPDDLGLDMPPRRLVQPRVGTLVLFPSSMWHGTVPFHAEGERLTAAFDIVPLG